MKSFTFDKSFDEVFTRTRLFYELSQLTPRPSDADEVRREIARGEFFGQEPRQGFYLPKSDGTQRTITIPATKTRILQTILTRELSAALTFSDRSYAFRRGKSPRKAISRVQDILRRGYVHVAKADIEHFFDAIDHTILIRQLRRIIRDPRIIHLIAYFLTSGALMQNRWVDKTAGVYQGDILSPLLSNIYLDPFDRELEASRIEFVRYSDDLLFLAATHSEAAAARKEAAKLLERLKLRFNPHKTYLSDIDKGFEYLGVYFRGETLAIDRKKLTDKITRLQHDTAKLPLEACIDKCNEKIIGFQNYYATIINDHAGAEALQERLETLVVEKIVQAKKQKKITTKAAFRSTLESLLSYTEVAHRSWVDDLISRAYERIAMEDPLRSAGKRVAAEKRRHLHKEAKSSEIIVSEPGMFLGISRGRIKVKNKGKVLLEAPVNRIRRIILLNRHATLSVYLIRECARRKIDIDFIDQGDPYAMITYYQHIMPSVHLEQLKCYFSPRGLVYAREIVHTKSRNQINLIKYLNRHRKLPRLQEEIDAMLQLHRRITRARDKKILMGLEGNISTHYWKAFGILLGDEQFKREHQHAGDVINQALNYGYAILYSRVQSALLHEGLNLHYPFLHSIQPNKPTLVFDMVEAFRQPVVDREILSIVNRNQRLTQTNGRLSKQTIKLIVQNIQERLATPTSSRYGKSTLQNIIGFQINHLKRTLLDGTTYKGFVNKY